MSKNWYVRESPSAVPVGPFTTAELRRELQAGRYGEALVATDGAAEWLPLRDELAKEDPLGNAPTAVHMAAVVPTNTLMGAAPMPRPASVPPPVPPPVHPSAPPPVHPSVRPSASPSARPSGRPPESAPPPPPASNVTILVLSAAAALLLAVAVFSLVLVFRGSRGPFGKDVSQGVVRVVMQSGSGTGFFVPGPDDLAYVATAYHVIASGEPILVEQTLEGAGGVTSPRRTPTRRSSPSTPRPTWRSFA